MREKAKSASAFFLRQNPALSGLDVEGLKDLMEADDSILNGAARQANSLGGTRPFWAKKLLQKLKKRHWCAK